MPCMKCANGKWKYGVHGRCQFDSKGKCDDAAAAIHAGDNKSMQNDHDVIIHSIFSRENNDQCSDISVSYTSE